MTCGKGCDLSGDREELMTRTRALAVIRSAKSPRGLYEAWLYHKPDIRIQGVGIEATKNKLEKAANFLSQFPTNIGSPEDISAALNFDGDEVMVFFVVQRPEVLLARPIIEVEANVGSISIPAGPSGPTPKTPPGIEPPIPLPPIAEPVSITDPEITCLYDGVQRIFASVVVPNIVETGPLEGSGDLRSFSTPRYGKPFHEKITLDLVELCNQIRLLGEGSGGGESGSGTLGFG
jgi:hypothetical protein